MLTYKTKDNETILASDSLSHIFSQLNEEKENSGNFSVAIDECLISTQEESFVCPIVGWNFIKSTVTLVVSTNLLSRFSHFEDVHVTFFGKKYKAASSESVKEDNEWKVTVYFEN